EQLADALVALLHLAYELLHGVADLAGEPADVAVLDASRLAGRRGGRPGPRGGRAPCPRRAATAARGALRAGGAIVVCGDRAGPARALLCDLRKRFGTALAVRDELVHALVHGGADGGFSGHAVGTSLGVRRTIHDAIA